MNRHVSLLTGHRFDERLIGGADKIVLATGTRHRVDDIRRRTSLRCQDKKEAYKDVQRSRSVTYGWTVKKGRVTVQKVMHRTWSEFHHWP